MTQEQIEGNEIIAIFDGWQKMSRGSIITWKRGGKEIFDVLQYHSSWDWLMQVVEKIMNIDLSEFNYNSPAMTQMRIYKEQLKSISITIPLHELFNVVVEICKWYNQNKQQ